MRWHKLGLVFAPSGQHAWMRSHAANPVPEHRGGDEFRVYFGCRDEHNRSHIAFVDIELGKSPRVLRVADAPILAPGAAGAFDDSGTSMGCLVQAGEKTFLYYLGWNLGVTVPWRNSIGLAVREHPDGPFVKMAGPILDRSPVDPFTLSYPSVVRHGARWRMWYGSNTQWGPSPPDLRHVIKHAESDDGVNWRRDGRIVLDLEGEDEIAVCRPWVEFAQQEWRMWYCRRGACYRLGLASSDDGWTWRRRQVPIALNAPSGDWDSDMAAYPAALEHNGQHYLFFNGNGYGKTGFGVAVAA